MAPSNQPMPQQHAPPWAAAAGASGIVGSGICRQLLMEGAKVAALLRREDQKDGLIKECQGALLRALHGERWGGATWWGAAGEQHSGTLLLRPAPAAPTPPNPCPRRLQVHRWITCSPTLWQTCRRRSSVSAPCWL